MAAAGRAHGLYTVAEMQAADRAAIESGIPGIELMERAGLAVADALRERYAELPVLVLAGPGNNGGDGFVVARLLEAAGWPVRLALLGDPAGLKGDAARARDRWQGPVLALEPAVLAGAGLVVDALFGAGLDRPIEGPARAVLEALGRSGLPVVAVDLPSGVNGDSGAVLGVAADAALTVTFHRAKPGHFLLPGRAKVGELVVAEIGIPDAVDQALSIRTFLNRPAVWRDAFPRRGATSHKYSHGHALVLGGGLTTSGASRLAARAALRAGAGLVTILVPEPALLAYVSQLTAVMVQPFAGTADFKAALADPRRNAILLGPGAGTGAPLRELVLAALDGKRAVVLDADALTSFEEAPEALFRRIGGPCLLTPHEGEFKRLFALEGDKLERARAAARSSGATVLLKGADTVIATPDGRAIIQDRAPPTLATAGSGDVLAGIALGLLAGGMPTLKAAAAAVWLHARAAEAFGPGLIAEDLPDMLPKVLRELPRT
jgi:NAD(P)H-hydrate epimerase